MKKICFVNTNTLWGGGEKWHFENSKAINELKDKYDVFFLSNKKGKLANLIEENEIKQKKMNISNLSFLNIFKVIILVAFLRKNKIETLIINQPNDLKIMGIVGRIAGVKNIIYRRGSAIPIKNRFTNRFIFRFLVDSIIANSNETKKTINGKNPNLFPEEKINVIYNGIMIDKIDGIIKEYDIRKRFGVEDKILIANVGRLTEQKGHKYLFEAVKRIKSIRDDFVVLLIGSGEKEEKIRSLARELKIERNLIFLGFQEDVYSILKQVDFMVHTALWEGFGYVVVESFACGKPVVATDISNISEIVTSSEYGYLAKSKDIEKISGAILKMMDNFKAFDEKKLKEKAKEFDFNKQLIELEKVL